MGHLEDGVQELAELGVIVSGGTIDEVQSAVDEWLMDHQAVDGEDTDQELFRQVLDIRQRLKAPAPLVPLPQASLEKLIEAATRPASPNAPVREAASVTARRESVASYRSRVLIPYGSVAALTTFLWTQRSSFEELFLDIGPSSWSTYFNMMYLLVLTGLAAQWAISWRAEQRFRGWLDHVFGEEFQNSTFGETVYGGEWTSVGELADVMAHRAEIPMGRYRGQAYKALDASAKETLDRLSADGVVEKRWEGQFFLYMVKRTEGG